MFILKNYLILYFREIGNSAYNIKFNDVSIWTNSAQLNIYLICWQDFSWKVPAANFGLQNSGTEASPISLYRKKFTI